MFSRILVPIDGSDTAWHAMEYARILGEKFSGSIVVLYVVQQYFNIPTLSLGDDVAVIPLTVAQLESVGRELLEEARTKLDGFPGKVDVRLDFGHPAERILAAASEEGCDAVVIGSRGLSGIAEFMMGSVSSKVSHYATIPVVIVK